MFLDVAIIAAALLLSLAYVIVLKPLRPMKVVAPEAPGQPVSGEERVRFRVWRFDELGNDPSQLTPYVVFAAILLALLAVLGKVVLAPHTPWLPVLAGCGGLCLVALLFVRGYTGILAAAIVTVPCYFLATWISEDPRVIGLITGLFLGAQAGILLSRRYVAILLRTRRELDEGRSMLGTPLTAWRRRLRHLLRLFLFLVPLMMLYHVVAYWAQPGLGAGAGAAGQTAVIVFVTLLGLNIMLFFAPMFREIVLYATLDNAADFNAYTHAVRSGSKKPPEPTVIDGVQRPRDATLILGDPAKRVAEHLDANGRWYTFHRSQVTGLVFLALYFVGNALGQGMNAAAGTGIPPSLTGSAEHAQAATLVLAVLTGLGFACNAFFLLGTLGFWADRGRERIQGEPIKRTEHQTADALWEAMQDPQVRFYVERESNDPVLRPITQELTGN